LKVAALQSRCIPSILHRPLFSDQVPLRHYRLNNEVRTKIPVANSKPRKTDNFSRIETCHLCSRPIYPSKGITFVRNDARTFRFCRSKCHKNFKMKRQPRKLKWTKTHRALRGKEMIVDQNVLLSQFAKRRNVPVKYDRNLVAATMKAMERVEEIRARRERAFTRRRLSGRAARERRRAEDRRVVAEGEHLIAKELKERERLAEVERPLVEEERNAGRLVGEERLRMKRKTRMLVNGGVEEEMDLD
jgi:large subunit ribosomal protein L24e